MMNFHNASSERLKRIDRLKVRRHARSLEMEMCRRDIVLWVNHWACTYDPREKMPNLPFELFPRQEEFLRWLEERDARQESGLAEKSRDVGLTWLCCAYSVHCLLFRPGDSTGFGSRKLDLVDDRDNPDSIFEKIRYLLNNLPVWMRPTGFRPEKHAKFCTILNPVNGSTITGEGVTEIGRGARKSRYFVDEAAFLPNPHSVEAALIATTRVRIDISTPNGIGSPFHTRRFSGKTPVFTFHWRDDPRKDDAWYEAQKARIGDPVIIAQELDIDYGAAIDGVVIPASWVAAACVAMEPDGPVVAGWDVADSGRCSNVLICRRGPVVTRICAWREMDVFSSARRAAEICAEEGAVTLCYDSVGVGAGVRGALDSLGGISHVHPVAVNGGSTPSARRWPDGKGSRERFRNLRAELWWMVRCRFEKSQAHLRNEHPPEELISIPRDAAELILQLSTPLYSYTETGKVQIESKDQMRRRGIPSPDYADALVLSFASVGGGWTEAALWTPAPHNEYKNW